MIEAFIINLCRSYPEIKATVFISLPDDLYFAYPEHETLARLARNSLDELETIALNSLSAPVHYLVYAAGDDLLQIHLVDTGVYFFVLQSRRSQSDLSWMARSTDEVTKLQKLLKD